MAPGAIRVSRAPELWGAKTGANPKDADMLYADIIQLSSASVLYLKAAGLLKKILKKPA
jgi:hypothetical protein